MPVSAFQRWPSTGLDVCPGTRTSTRSSDPAHRRVPGERGPTAAQPFIPSAPGGIDNLDATLDPEARLANIEAGVASHNQEVLRSRTAQDAGGLTDAGSGRMLERLGNITADNFYETLRNALEARLPERGAG